MDDPDVVEIPPPIHQHHPRFKKQKQSIDHDVIEIPPPIHQHLPRFKKQKQSIDQDVIHIDDDDDDLIILGEKAPGGSPWFKNSHNFDASSMHVHGSSSNLHNGAADAAVVPPGLTITDKPENQTLKNLRNFKQFDTAIDTSDHHFIRKPYGKQNPKEWAKYIQYEWKILEKHLPDTIFVRVYESRMDLMRAVIIGAEGIPYHDGLFCFDIYFLIAIPIILQSIFLRQHVIYRSGGHRLNPNLYQKGKVCLSLLDTWAADKSEQWNPYVSTMLQVLVSIQGLILNAKPYFNEPAFAHMSGWADGEKKAMEYNENIFILSMLTVMYMIRNPPKNFEDLVKGHFYSRGRDILKSCKAYMKGVQVGCWVKGRVQDVKGSEGKNSSNKFKADLVRHVPSLVKYFESIGVKDLEIYITDRK